MRPMENCLGSMRPKAIARRRGLNSRWGIEMQRPTHSGSWMPTD